MAKLGVKRAILPVALKSIDAFLAIGTANANYYRQYGVPPHQIFSMPYAVDNDFFQRAAQIARSNRPSLKKRLGLSPERPVILYASKLQKRKRPADLLEAYIRLSPDGIREPNAYLLFVGDGEERMALEQRAGALRWSSIRFLGFKNQTEMPEYYELCDVFVLPSEHEPWGLAVNEVMNAAKPVIITDQVGCGADLISNGKNGFIVPVGNIDQLSAMLRTVTVDPELGHRMGQAGRKRIDSWNFESDRQGLLKALAYVLDTAA